jgi:peptidoglycan endopeptidase LytE
MMEQKIKSRSRLKTAFFCVLAVNLIPITIALLMQGCRKPASGELATETNTMAVSPLEYTNAQPVEANASIPAVALPATPVATATEYVIKSGDNFTTIAKEFPGVTAKQIQEANPTVDPLKLQVGHKLIIPPPMPVVTSATAPAVPDLGAGELMYTVKSGDTLTKIATDHGTTVRAIRSLNNLQTDRIKVGEKLKIPARATPAPAPSSPVASNSPA